MLAYKGFRNDLTCTLGKGRYQYRENEWHEENCANCMSNGFHCAENPIDCLIYYPDWDTSAYYLVEAGGDIDEDNSDSKISCTRIKLLRRLSVYDFTVAAVEYICRYPYRKIRENNNRRIRLTKNKGKAVEGGAVIVWGESPQASGPAGSVLALIKIGADRKIKGVCVRNVDGDRYKADTWYRI